MLGLKLNHVSKRGHWSHSDRACSSPFLMTSYDKSVFAIINTLLGNPPITSDVFSQRASNSELIFFVVCMTKLLNIHLICRWLPTSRFSCDVLAKLRYSICRSVWTQWKWFTIVIIHQMYFIKYHACRFNVCNKTAVTHRYHDTPSTYELGSIVWFEIRNSNAIEKKNTIHPFTCSFP